MKMHEQRQLRKYREKKQRENKTNENECKVEKHSKNARMQPKNLIYTHSECINV